MSGLATTFAWLAETENEAAVDTLAVAACSDQGAIRRQAIDALLNRQCQRCGRILMKKWPHFSIDDRRRVTPKAEWMTPFVAEALKGDEESILNALDAAQVLGLINLVDGIAKLAETGRTEGLRDRATETIRSFAELLNEQVERGTVRASQRGTFLSRLSESARRMSIHRNEELVDCLLIASNWSDSELRCALEPESQTADLLVERLSTSCHPQVVKLLAEGLQKRSMPEDIGTSIRTRDDERFRRVLLHVVGTEPSASVIRNLRQLGQPACCRNPLALLDDITQAQQIALLHVLAATDADSLETLQVACQVLAMNGEAGISGFVRTLNQCGVPSADVWMPAAKIIAGGRDEEIFRDSQASLLMDLVQILDHPERRMGEAVARILGPLHAKSMLTQLPNFGRRSRHLLGRVVMMVDATAIDAVRDALRHPVLDRRLEALTAVEAFAAIDLLHKELAHIVREGHLEARRVAAEMLGNGVSPQTEALLVELCSMPENAIRDVADEAYKRRTGKDFQRGPETSREEPAAAPTLEFPDGVEKLNQLNVN